MSSNPSQCCWGWRRPTRPACNRELCIEPLSQRNKLRAHLVKLIAPTLTCGSSVNAASVNAHGTATRLCYASAPVIRLSLWLPL
jgi:hypothetical protein